MCVFKSEAYPSRTEKGGGSTLYLDIDEQDKSVLKKAKALI